MLSFKRFIFAVFLDFCLIMPATAAEFIEHFNADITVNTDGSLTITETIVVHHKGQRIKRGIYRDLSTKKGEQYKILEVKRNHFLEPWFTEKKDTVLRLNTGDNELLPNPATSVFELSYVVYDALRSIRGENLNELYWNVTGIWAFPMDKVTVQVHYPENTEVVRQYVYKTAHDAKAMPPKTEILDLGNLPANFEVTIAQAFTQGTVHIPFPRLYKTLILALVVTLFYFLVMWWYCGKDPQSLPIVPDWNPPSDLSPLECAVLNKMGKMPSNAFFIHIVWLISQKIVTVAQQKYSGLFGVDEVYELTTNADIAEERKVGEIKLYLDNFPNMLRLMKKPSEKITSYQQELTETVQKKFNKKYYNRHGGVTFFGALIFPCVWMWLFPESIGLILWCLMWGSGIISMIVQRRWLWAVPFIAVLIPILGMMLGFDIVNAALFATYGAVIYAFNYLMFEPTFIGQRQIEKIAGLKMFLEAVTGNSATPQHDKRVTPFDMEQLFPYAVALGLEKAWSKKYEAVFGAEALAGVQKSHIYYMPQIRANLGHYCSTAASYVPPSASSGGLGSFGGGHAGGGFGGGGGGGR